MEMPVEFRPYTYSIPHHVRALFALTGKISNQISRCYIMFLVGIFIKRYIFVDSRLSCLLICLFAPFWGGIVIYLVGRD
jgi:hypothetical protein